MRHHQRHWFLVATLAAASSCGVPPPSTADAGQPPTADAGSPSPSVTKLAAAFCDFQNRCCGATASGCEPAASQALAAFGALWSETADGGLDACLQDLTTAPCSNLRFLFERTACVSAFRIARPIGSPCLEYLGCGADANCVLGACAAAGQAGAACTGNPECYNGLCRYRSCALGLACVSGSCRPWASNNGTCRGDGGSECYPATHYCSCANPLTGCTSGGTCSPKQPAGAACSTSSQCLSSCGTSVCDADTSYRDFRCQ